MHCGIPWPPVEGDLLRLTSYYHNARVLRFDMIVVVLSDVVVRANLSRDLI
jgi:hypothetical protein